MGEGGFWDDQEAAQSRVSVLKSARKVIDSYDTLQRKTGDAEALIEIAEELSSDPESLAEVARNVDEVQRLYDELEIRTLLSGPFDHCSAHLTIQAGAGGTDASDWAEILLRMYQRWAELMEFPTTILEVMEHEEAGIKHATMHIDGAYAFGYLTAEMGVHRLVRISPFDAQARRQTSFAAVDVTPDLGEVADVEVLDKDLAIDTYRAGGKGGQHVNKTESAVRITHVPTGIVVQCQSERSQHKNKAAALNMLKAKLVQRRDAERSREIKAMYDSKGQIAWGNQIRNYVLAPYTLVKDTRTGHEVGNVQPVLDGSIQQFIDAYLRQRSEEQAARRRKAEATERGPTA